MEEGEIIETKLRPYKCEACGHEVEIETNHEGPVFHYCLSCSNQKMEPYQDFKIPALDDRTYRKFWHIKDWEEVF